jgi:hypothetical protein
MTTTISTSSISGITRVTFDPYSGKWHDVYLDGERVTGVIEAVLGMRGYVKTEADKMRFGHVEIVNIATGEVRRT